MQNGFELALAQQRHQELLARSARERLAVEGRRRPVRRGLAVVLRRLADRLEQPALGPAAAA